MKIVAFIFLAPLIGMIVALGLTVLLYYVCKKANPHKANRWFKKLQLLSSALFSIGHDEKDIPADPASDHSEDRLDDCENVSSYLSFVGGSKDAFELEVQNLLYAEAEGNYIKLVYLEGNKVMQKLLRMTMKQAEGIVQSYSSILRCHRAYLVNIHFVARVDGNMQGYRLRLKHCSEEVPVSRAYTKQFKIHLKNPMMGANSIADIRFLFEFLSKLHTVECVWQFRFFIRHFTYIVE